mmetsp:Transcript_20960/g.36748  ORF Transcript_20960/g.36748 Transcript_20960/m.36748 type:complete len:346 (+) Transcript_20960:3-1040(+)
MADKKVWEVIGGKDKGGIVVREEQSLKSKELAERLSVASLVEEVVLVGKRLQYKLLTGSGPETGWVSINVADKDLLNCISKPRAPLFCAWYSGGFSVKDGEKQLAPLLNAVKEAGVANAAVFHFPDGYDLDGEGREPWAGYVDRLIEEIGKVAEDKDQPLILFGHSRGASPAVCLATRLGSRVKHVYIAACGAMQAGQPTAWENLSLDFKKGGDRELLTWFSSLQPENVVLRRVAIDTTDDEFVEQVNCSKFLLNMLSLMRRQYRDAMYPDPDRDFKPFPANITTFAPLYDAGSQPEHLQEWSAMTLGKFLNVSVHAGHMDCIMPNAKGKCELFDWLKQDLKKYL